MKIISIAILLNLTFLYSPNVVRSQVITPTDVTIIRNEIPLKGKFFLAEGKGLFPTVILLDGFPGNESDVLGIGKQLSKSSFNALTFNYSGTYKSGGKVSWDNMQSDIGAAYEFLLQSENINNYNIDTSNIYLGGWCTGGGMALTYAAYHQEVKNVFSITPSDQIKFMKIYVGNPEIKKIIDKSFDEITYPKGHLRFEKGATPKEIAETGIDKINHIYNLKQCTPLLAKKNILLIGGLDDKQTTMEIFIMPLYRALQNQSAANVQFLTFQDDHYFRKSHLELAKEVITWLNDISVKE